MKNLTLFAVLAMCGTLFFGCEKYNPSLGEPPVDTDALFTFVPTAANPNIIDFSASNPDILARWDFGNGTKGDGSTATAIYPNAGTYTVTLTVFNKGGSASSTQDLVIDQTDPTLLDNPFYDMLTGGNAGPGSKTWHIDSLVPAHFGVGPRPIGGAGNYPEWYAAAPNDKSGGGLYNDRYVFYLNNFQFDMLANGDVYVDDLQSANFPGGYSNLSDWTAPYNDQVNESWLIDFTDTTLAVSGNSFLGFYTGVSVYNIINLSDTSLWLQYQDQNDPGLYWYLRLIPDGFVSNSGGGGGGGGGGSATLPIDFESNPPSFDDFGGTAHAVVSNSNAGGINTSSQVLEVTHGFETWAGLFVDLAGTLDFTTQTNIDLKVYAPTTGTIRVKLENSSNPNDFVEIDGTVTAANTWQLVSIDFSAATSGVYDRLVLFPGWNTTSADVFYIDDIQQN